ALVGVAAAATGTGAGIVDNNIIEPEFGWVQGIIQDDDIIEPLAEETPVDIVEGLDETEAEYDFVPDFVEEELLIAAEKLLMEDMTEEEIQSVLQNVYDNIDGVVMVYVISPRGIIEAVYPDEFHAAVGDFIVRSPVGGTVVKAREFFVTNEYTSARENITGYDAVQPIIADSGQYLGAIVAKFSS
ncbi:MAG: PDC sensor domain-containing protein, partial [Euryarchaeota archaeon]|nr:PDC sensor domain-containing protein [Euryarchaeota archaeon]